MRELLLLSCFFGAMTLTGCTDSSDSKSRGIAPLPVEPPDQALTGYLVDSAVSGVSYGTPTHTGTTGSEGEFQYEAGETVRFMIGDTLLGEVAGQERVTPFDLSVAEVLTGTPQIAEAVEWGHHPFQRVVNTAVLLQSLDSDRNPQNGIEITAEVAALFDDVALDMSEGSSGFQGDPRLRLIMRRANAQDLFREAHGVVKRAIALEHLYDAMGVSANILVPIRREWMDGADPSDHDIEVFEYGIYGYATYEANVNPDGTPGYATRSRYDSLGNLTEQAVEPTDSCPPGVIHWQYDASGDITRIAWNWDSQGRDEFTEQWQYGPDGEATRLTELDWGGEGRPSLICGDIAYVGEIDFDWENNKFVGTEVAYSSDGVPEYIERDEYDANGNLTKGETDQNADGIPEFVTSRQYDASGNLTRSAVDEDGDGKLDSITTYEFNADENIVRHAQDEDGDGTPEIIEITEYDSNGYRTRVGFDDDGDGDIDTTTLFAQRDVDGNIIRGEFDPNGDGFPELIVENSPTHGRSISDWDSDGVPNSMDADEFDENGRLIRYEQDSNADGIAEEVELYSYHANDQLKRIETISDSGRDDGFGDGLPDQIEVEEYDVNGNPTLREEDYDGDGEIDVVGRLQYDSNGNLIRFTEDEHNDGVLDIVEIWQYDEYGNLTLHEQKDGDVVTEGADAWQYEYDANGYVTRKAWDGGNDGTIDRVETWLYDDDGNLLRSEVDENGDGKPEVTTVEYVPGSWGAFFPSEPERDPREGFGPADL